MAGVRKRRESGFRVREKREALRRAKSSFPFPAAFERLRRRPDEAVRMC